VAELPTTLYRILDLLVALLPGGLWVAWWLGAVNWTKMWPVLARGAWAPVLLLMAMATAVWSRLAPGDCTCLGFVRVPNFWWQLGGVSTLASTALLCGWIQGRLGWAPPEMSVEPPPEAHGDGHDYGHH
jgi:hypothetical protein